MVLVIDLVAIGFLEMQIFVLVKRARLSSGVNESFNGICGNEVEVVSHNGYIQETSQQAPICLSGNERVRQRPNCYKREKQSQLREYTREGYVTDFISCHSPHRPPFNQHPLAVVTHTHTLVTY